LADVSIFGLGKVGHTLACCLAAKGNRVVGFDNVADVVNAVNGGTYQSQEGGVAERLARIKPGLLRAASSAEEAVLASDVSMIIVPTPSNALGGFSLRFVLDACSEIGAALRKKSSAHVVAVLSTVLPGASGSYIVPALESASGRVVGDQLGYCYNPSFIALGEVVKGLEEPDYVLIGQADEVSGDAVETVHRSILDGDKPIVRMNLLEAEIAKIASNTHETMRVAFANMLFALCSELPSADVDRITGALSYRMGRRFFRGALPYGGPCWPRDNRAFASFMDAVGVPSLIPHTIDLSNAEHGRYVLQKVLAAAERGETVGLLRLSYKPGTHVIDCSFGIDLAEWLLCDGRHVIAWDPMAIPETRQVLGDCITYAATPEECVRSSRVTIIINPMQDLEAIDWSAASGTTVMDPWRCLSDAATSRIGTYVPMGRGNPAINGEWPSADLGAKLRLLNS